MKEEEKGHRAHRLTAGVRHRDVSRQTAAGFVTCSSSRNRVRRGKKTTQTIQILRYPQILRVFNGCGRPLLPAVCINPFHITSLVLSSQFK